MVKESSEITAQPSTPTDPSGYRFKEGRVRLWLVVGLVIGIAIAGVPLTLYCNYIKYNYSILQNNYLDLLNQYANLQTHYSFLQSSYAILQSQRSNETVTIVNAQQVILSSLSEHIGSSREWTFNVSRAGYVNITVSSNVSETSVGIMGMPSSGFTYSSSWVNVGYNGTLLYPVLPGKVIVYVANNALFSDADVNVTITYTY
jgi:hypothetical protein